MFLPEFLSLNLLSIPLFIFIWLMYLLKHFYYSYLCYKKSEVGTLINKLCNASESLHATFFQRDVEWLLEKKLYCWFNIVHVSTRHSKILLLVSCFSRREVATCFVFIFFFSCSFRTIVICFLLPLIISQWSWNWKIYLHVKESFCTQGMRSICPSPGN